ncbi:MAG: peptidase M10A and M12B matrixin and adamalysin [Parcubacteria group bacterium Athens0714_25]|nr:MAG: peptidase M10A and M12B matrixin and adamalysin [Parcubacteria group bacterium Athens0714_25]
MSTFIKKYFFLAVLIFFGAVAINALTLRLPSIFEISPSRLGCEQPIHWSLGEIDSRFPLDTKQFRQAAFEAEKIWEDALGKDVFVFDPQSSFQIKTEFDQRQQMTYEAQDLEKNIGAYEKESDLLEKNYQTLKIRYEQQMAQFETLKKEFEKKLKEYNKDVADWNSGDRTSSKEYEKLQEEEKELQNLQENLQEKTEEVNKTADELNALAQKLNIKTADVKKVIETFKEKYGEAKPFVQGLYYPPLQGITIFEFKEKEDLRLVLAHEMGHALGIEEHIKDNPASLMYYLMDQQDIENPSLTQQDIQAYSSACPSLTLSPLEKFKRYLILTPWKEMKLSEIFNLFEK